jgi:uncharacterized membrane protein
MRLAASMMLTLLALSACDKVTPPAKPPAAGQTLPVVVEHGAPAPAAVAPAVPAAVPVAAAPAAPPSPPVPAAPPAPKPAASPPPSAFAGDFDLIGTEPFWNLQIRAGALKLSRPEHADFAAANPGYNEFGKTAMWNATAGKSHMTVTVTKARCTDGMSDRTYAYSAKVALWGTTLSGCAARPRS